MPKIAAISLALTLVRPPSTAAKSVLPSLKALNAPPAATVPATTKITANKISAVSSSFSLSILPVFSSFQCFLANPVNLMIFSIALTYFPSNLLPSFSIF